VRVQKESYAKSVQRDQEDTRVALPDTFEVHRADFDNMTRLLALQDAISSASRHSGDIQKLGTVDHVIVYE
jgi:hypothetical protein